MLAVGTATGRACWTVALVLILAGCTLPRSGPTSREIRQSATTDDGITIVAVDQSVVLAARSEEAVGFTPALMSAGLLSADVIRPGDTLSISLWETLDSGRFASAGQQNSSIEAIQVDQDGAIFIPYAGRLRAAGETPESLRRRITEALSDQTPDVQVQVRRLAGDGATVSVIGGVTAQGVYPIETPTRRLSAMLARAGGVALRPDVAQIRVEREGQTGRIWLQDLYDDATNDIALRGGDRIIIEEDRRSFTALGAAGMQRRINFAKRDLSLIEALADAGGLDGRAADPTGVFVFRVEPSGVANAVTGRNDFIGPQRVAYVVDFTSPEGLFAAREFVVRDEDTIYVTEAPFAAWSRILTTATGSITFAGAADSLAN